MNLSNRLQQLTVTSIVKVIASSSKLIDDYSMGRERNALFCTSSWHELKICVRYVYSSALNPVQRTMFIVISNGAECKTF